MSTIRCLDCRTTCEADRSGRCTRCRLRQQRAKDATPQRRALKAKYNASHRKLRSLWAPIVAQGTVDCWRCRQPIEAGSEWDLGHRDGQAPHPEHARECNRAHANDGKESTTCLH